ncbi:MAG: carotenoid biosynthesis protein [Candidatus Hodarchaeota archaeon]
MGFFILAAELMSISLFLVIIIFLGLKKKDYRAVAQIFAGSCFGIVVEFMFVLVAKEYNYSTQFLFQIGSPPVNTPIIIGLCWGLIIYACMQVSDLIGLDEWFKPILDALLGLTIDLSMDTIAIRLDGGFWTWVDVPLEVLPTLNSFMGVNYRNFVAWFLIILVFSFLLRFEQKVLQGELNVPKFITVTYFCVIPFFGYILLFLAYNVSLFPVFLIIEYLNIIKVSLGIQQVQQLSALVIIISIVVSAGLMQIIAFDSRTKVEKQINWIPISVFLYFHLSYLGFYIAAGIFWEVPLILLVAFFMLTLDIFIHWKILDQGQVSNLIFKIKNQITLER